MGKGRGKGTKKGWKKVGEGGMGEGVKEVYAQREMEEKKDSELFFEDVKGIEHFEKLTNRQKRALEHRNRMERSVSGENLLLKIL